MFVNTSTMKTNRRPTLVLLLVALALAGAGALACSPAAKPTLATPAPKLKVLATTTQIAALATVVGGDRIELNSILKSGVDAHEYQATPQDVRAAAEAQLILKNGAGLEKWLDKITENSGTHAPIVDTSKGVALRKGDEEEPGGDPHIWQSAANAILMLNNVRDGMVAADPANAATYTANAAAYEKKLNDLDQYIIQQIATIPEANRKFVSNHDAFGYYTDRYGLTYVGSIIPSMDSSFEPSAQELAALVKAIKAQGVKAIFTESSISPALAKQIAAETGVKVVDGALYGDSLGPPGSGADTLDGMLKANTDLIVENLK